MLMHVAGIFPDNYIYGKCIYYIWEYGEIGENNTYLCTDHAPQVYIPCRIPCSSLVQYCYDHVQLRALSGYSGHGRADIPPLSTTLGLIPTQSLLHLTVYPALT